MGDGGVMSVHEAPPAVVAPLLSDVLRQLVTTIAGPSILTCEFAPGGRLHGAGIPGPYHCAHCNPPRMWHQVALAIPDVEWAEQLSAAGFRRGRDL